MKNRDKDARLIPEIKSFQQKIFCSFLLRMKKLRLLNTSFLKIKLPLFLPFKDDYFFRYMASFTSATVRGTSGSAAATRLGA